MREPKHAYRERVVSEVGLEKVFYRWPSPGVLPAQRAHGDRSMHRSCVFEITIARALACSPIRGCTASAFTARLVSTTDEKQSAGRSPLPSPVSEAGAPAHTPRPPPPAPSRPPVLELQPPPVLEQPPPTSAPPGLGGVPPRCPQPPTRPPVALQRFKGLRALGTQLCGAQACARAVYARHAAFSRNMHLCKRQQVYVRSWEAC